MQIVALRTFLAIVETGSLVRAADTMHVSQSTVTARLKSLEDALGQPLIRRRKSGAQLTPAGERLRRYASTISDLWQQARQEAALPDGFRAVCNIACEEDLWPGLGQRLYRLVRAARADLAVSVWTGSASDVSDWMASGRSELSLTYRPAALPELDRQVLPDDVLVLVASDPQAPMRFDPDYILVEAGEAFSRDHAVAYADAGVARLSAGSARLGLELLLDHGGSAYLPIRIAQPHLIDGRLHAVAGAPKFTRPVVMQVHQEARQAWPWFDNVTKSLLGNDVQALR